MIPRLEVQALGPLRVFVDGEPVDLGRGNECALLVLLGLQAGKPVSVERIVDLLWPEEPPPSAREMVRIYVGRSRKRLGEKAISTGPGGYALEAGPDAVDTLRFEALCKEGSRRRETGDTAGAVTVLDVALTLWRGEPLSELDLPFARDERARLEEVRVGALEDRVDAELALGRAGELVPGLEALVREHPYRERLRRQLMLALYRAGRQTEALASYRAGRQLLVDAVGVEPGPDLRALERAILAHDPMLLAEAPPPGVEPEPVTPRRKRRLAPLVLIGVVGVAAAVTVPLVVLDRGLQARRVGRNSLAAIDARPGGGVDSSVRLGGFPGPVAVDADRVWLGDGTQRALVEVDPNGPKVVHTTRLSNFPYRLVTGNGAVWVANGFEGTISRIAGTSVRKFRPEPGASGRVQLGYGYASLWAASQDGVLVRLDPVTLRARTRLPGIGHPEALAVGLGGVWLAQATRSELTFIDPERSRIARTIPIGGFAGDVATGEGSVWAVTPTEGRLWRIDPKRKAVTAAIDVGSNPTSVAVTPGAIWVGSRDGGISRVDPAQNRVVATFHVPGPVAGIAADPSRRRLWITVR